MCGIFALIQSQKKHQFNFNIFRDYLNSPFITKRTDLLQELLDQHSIQQFINKIQIDLHQINEALKNRGPDYQNQIILNNPYQCILYHSLLHMRGDQNKFVKQPLVNDHLILQYNGEIYNIDPDKSDTTLIMEKFHSFDGDIQQIQQFLQSLNGDYSFIIHDLKRQIITICKDPFGKKSLLLGFTEDGFILSSQAIGEQVIEQSVDDDDENDDGKTVDEKYLMKKYLNEFNQSLNKSYLEIPNNSIIQIDLSKDQIQWNHYNIFPNIIESLVFKIEQPNQSIINNTFQLLIQSTQEIVRNIFGFQEYFLNQDNNTNIINGKIGVLFSGGIDCSLIVHILCLLLPKNAKIDLINVAFADDAPDRITAIAAHKELQQIHANHNLNLILLDKSLDDVYQQEKLFLNIIYPKITHMDFNIAMILRLASAYNVETRVLLSGLGADEIFAGYARYRHAIKRGGNDLLEEMNFDLIRLWIRNLGRDDRAVSSMGKELRFPFLNLELIQYIRQNVNPEKYQNGSTKTILRDICIQQGLLQIAQHNKKAIQFGTKIAKLSNKRFFGGNKRAKGTANYNLKQ